MSRIFARRRRASSPVRVQVRCPPPDIPPIPMSSRSVVTRTPPVCAPARSMRLITAMAMTRAKRSARWRRLSITRGIEAVSLKAFSGRSRFAQHDAASGKVLSRTRSSQRAMIPSELSKLLEGDNDLEKEYENVSRTLESIGLSSYEAKGYIALVAHGHGSAELIAETAHIPRTSAYKVLQSLVTKGFAISTRGRPTIFKPEPPSKIKEKVIERLGETFDKLNLLHEILRDKGEPQLVYTVAGKARVMEKIGEMLDTATRN